MTTSRTVLAGRIERALDGVPDAELVIAALGTVARIPLARYCTDGEKNDACRELALPGGDLDLESLGPRCPARLERVGDVAWLAVLLDDVAESGDRAARARDQLVEWLVAPLRSYEERSRAMESRASASAPRESRRKVPAISWRFVASRLFRNAVTPLEARALYWSFVRASVRDVIEAVSSLPRVPPEEARAMRRRAVALGRSRDATASALALGGDAGKLLSALLVPLTLVDAYASGCPARSRAARGLSPTLAARLEEGT